MVYSAVAALGLLRLTPERGAAVHFLRLDRQGFVVDHAAEIECGEAPKDKAHGFGLSIDPANDQ